MHHEEKGGSMSDPGTHRGLFALALLFALLFLAVVPGAAGQVSAAAGDEIELSGTAEGADEVYLFVTGPNLPGNGARLDDISAGVETGDPASFTRVAVAEGRWRYIWDTQTAGGVPDPGTYTVYAVREPVGRQDLGDASYATITFTLTRPGLNAVIGESGTLAVRSDPPGAEVYVDGILQGTTPVDLTGVPAGTHTLELRKAGYAPINESIEVEAGGTTEIVRQLEQPTAQPTLPPAANEGATQEPTPSVDLSILPVLAALTVWAYARAGRRR
jgi:hypothetical protein